MEVLDKDSESYEEYQLYLKQYMTDVTKFNSFFENSFSLLLGGCSPAMEQSLVGEKDYKVMKEISNSISLSWSIAYATISNPKSSHHC